jgi:hypothetical protein
MSTTPSTVAIADDPIGTSLRLRLTAAVFNTVQLIPRFMELRKSKSSWLGIRVAAGFTGAALVILPLGLGRNFVLVLPILGLVLFTTAILMPPALAEMTDKEKAEELGALIMVDGGDYQRGSVLGFPAKIFVGADEVWVLDPHHQELAAIPVKEIVAANTEVMDGNWSMRITWGADNNQALFAYDGLFAEYLACVATGAVRGVMGTPDPAKAKARAAGA